MWDIGGEDSKYDPKVCMGRQVMEYLYDMMLTDTLCDATINLKDGSFKIHRVILSACSSYFKTLFTTTLTTAVTDVRIPGVRSEIMEKIIKFAYMRECEINKDNVYELFTIADYVAMLDLVWLCVDFLIDILSPENCFRIMFFARAKFCDELYSKARLYILRNFVEVSVKSQEILQIGLRDFYDIISDDMLNSKDEERVWECCLRWIDYDAPNRAQHVVKLMRGVRLGLLNVNFFMEKVKDNQHVVNCDAAKPIVIETLTFLYDLDMIGCKDEEIRTPPLAVPRLPHEVIFAIGGWSEGLPQRCIETYDTRADRWVRISEEDPGGPRAYHGTAVIGHKLYCIGGFNGMDYFNTCRVFDAAKKTWKEISPMHNQRCYVSVTVLDGIIYAMGGYDGQSRQNTAERYDPTTNQWSMIASMGMQRSDASACTLNGKIYITGGFNGQECMNSAECYDPVTNEWSPIPNMNARRSGVSCITHKGFIYVVGGFNGLSRLRSAERFDTATQTWTHIHEMTNPRSNFGLEIIDDMIFAIGGFNGTATISHTECYDPETDEWLEATNMGIIRSALSANAIKDLPNIKDYTHKERESLIEDRRRRMFAYESDNDEGNVSDIEESTTNITNTLSPNRGVFFNPLHNVHHGRGSNLQAGRERIVFRRRH